MKLEKYMSVMSIFGIIISKFHYKKKLYLIILFKINKSLKIGFYYIILSLNRAIYLKIKGSRQFLFDAKEII